MDLTALKKGEIIVRWAPDGSIDRRQQVVETWGYHKYAQYEGGAYVMHSIWGVLVRYTGEDGSISTEVQPLTEHDVIMDEGFGYSYLVLPGGDEYNAALDVMKFGTRTK